MIRIDGHAFDAAIREEHRRQSKTTRYPVEDGTQVSDHIIYEPQTLTIESVASDHPIGDMVAERDRERQTPPDGLVPTFQSVGRAVTATPSKAALAKLERLHASRKPVIVETTLMTYTDMVCEELTIPRDAESGDALWFSASFVKLIRVTNKRTVKITATPRGQRKRSLGARAVDILFAPARIVAAGIEALAPRAFFKPGVGWVDKDGKLVDPQPYSKKSERAPRQTYFDYEQDRWMNDDGTPVTQSRMSDSDGSLDTRDRGKPWWRGGPKTQSTLLEAPDAS